MTTKEFNGMHYAGSCWVCGLIFQCQNIDGFDNVYIRDIKYVLNMGLISNENPETQKRKVVEHGCLFNVNNIIPRIHA